MGKIHFLTEKKLVKKGVHCRKTQRRMEKCAFLSQEKMELPFDRIKCRKEPKKLHPLSLPKFANIKI